MGLLNVLRSRERRQRLPVYEPLESPTAPSKERYGPADHDYSDDDSDDDYLDEPLSSAGSSRKTSSSLDSGAMMLPKREAFASVGSPARRSRRPYFYRIPNKIVRYLCAGMIVTILLFMFSLVRASQAENQRILKGEVDKAAAPPAPWEAFEFLTRYYGGVRSLVPFEENIPQYPRDEDEQPFNATGGQVPPRPHLHPDEHQVNEGPLPPSRAFPEYPGSVLAEGQSDITQCFIDKEQSVHVPPIRYFEGRPSGFPLSVGGSYELLSLPEDICFERYGRYGPYGFGYSVRSGGLGTGEYGEKEGAEEVWKTVRPVDWRRVDWADTQRRCFQSNAHRFKAVAPRVAPPRGFYIAGETEKSDLQTRNKAPGKPDAAGAEKEPLEQPSTTEDMPRTAVVVRCWDEFTWTPEAIMYIRSLITELALASGGRYDVHLLVEVKNDAKYPIWADEEAYQARIDEVIPAEFRGLVTLWTQTQMLSVYQGIHDLYSSGPDLPVHGVYRGLQMAMQLFAHDHPEYDYFWQWEMDIRYTGHYYDLLAKMEGWAKAQPRKGLWERNARFYFPSVHGSWDDFRQMARVQTEIGTTSADNVWENVNMPGGGGGGGRKGGKKAHEGAKGERSVWGPVRPADHGDWFETDADPVPPTTSDRDKYVWGVGEEADLISMNPIFDPEGTTWLLADDITGYNETAGQGKPPRRAHIITASRMSRRLLTVMHRETAHRKRHAFPEMWPATAALQHGLKAVYAPHPVYVDREWPTGYMAATFNAGRNGASGGARASVYGRREHNLRGVSWFYNSGFAPNLYRRWMGLRVNNDGGEQFERDADRSRDDASVGAMRGGEGRMCLPPMLLHPVKDVELPVEENPEEIVAGEPGMGPDA